MTGATLQNSLINVQVKVLQNAYLGYSEGLNVVCFDIIHQAIVPQGAGRLQGDPRILISRNPEAQSLEGRHYDAEKEVQNSGEAAKDNLMCQKEEPGKFNEAQLSASFLPLHPQVLQ